MLLRYHGHAMFEMTSAEGFCIVTDPYDASVGYPMKEIRADLVTVSHGHFDHNHTASCPGARVLDKAGEFSPAPGVRVKAFHSFHDEVQGAKRGENLIFLYEMEGLRLCHLGDLGHLPDEKLLKALGPVDLLMLPIGGTYTLDAGEAWETARRIAPRVILPMHYRTRVNAGWAIDEPDAFKALAGKGRGPCPLLRVTREDIGCCPPIIWMDWET